ncbi:hypothetical protein GCM10027615_59190 [Plantactinospora veratri]
MIGADNRRTSSCGGDDDESVGKHPTAPRRRGGLPPFTAALSIAEFARALRNLLRT